MNRIVKTPVLCLLLWAGTLLLVTSPASGRQAGSFEFGLFGHGTKYDDALPFSTTAGGGGRLGFYFLKNLAIEADVAYSSLTAPVGMPSTHLPVRARLLIAQPAGPLASILVGAGGVYNKYGDLSYAWDMGVSGLLGVQVNLGKTLSIRANGIGDYSPVNQWAAATEISSLNLGAQIGIGFRFGGAGAPQPRVANNPNEPTPPRPTPTPPADTDRDGVPDPQDRCANTPANTQVDAAGCPLPPADTDRDGVPDASDRCANTPAGTRVDTAGCPLPPADADQDGVPDASDRCAGTPAGTTVDANGCPLPLADSDRDGVPDPQDRCANTPAGTAVGSTGCPLPPADSDRDGIPDAQDRCANTPAGTTVDSTGCALPPADADADGVPDARDQCANTPAGTAVGPNGCPLPPADADADGVPDSRDQCANTPTGTAVGPNGCPLPPADADGDGVPDASDQCPNTPAGATVSNTGCPLPPADTDRDGVPDAQDQCANTPAGTAVGANGCPTAPADADRDGVPDAQDACPNTPAGTTVDATGCAPPPADSDRDGVPDAQDRCPGTDPSARVDATGCVSTAPARFPWPPANVSAREQLTEDYITGGQRRVQIGFIQGRLQRILTQSGYPAVQVYPAPGGFAMVTPIERIDDGGTPLAGPNRWVPVASRQADFSVQALQSQIAASGTPGRFRVFAFVVSDASGTAQGTALVPTAQIARMQYSQNHVPTVLVYEFVLQAGGTSTLVEGRSPQDHLRAAGIWTRLSAR